MRLTVLIYILLIASLGWCLSDQDIAEITSGFEARRDSMLASQVASPYPSIDSFVWNRQDFALSALYLNTQLSEANQAIIDACNYLKDNPTEYDVDFHWRGNLFYRIYKYFYHDSEYFPGRLTTAAEEAIYDIFWNWAKYKSVLSDADYSQSQTWYTWGSENHDAMRKSTSYSAADILKDAPAYQNLAFDDGSTAAQQYEAWNAYFKEYLRERAKKGLLIEVGSHTYSKYTLQGWYNFYDFAPDAELRKLAGMSLDLWWADWAQDQIGGVRGGGKSRIYQDADELARDDSAYSMCWYYLNIGTASNKHPGMMCLATSGYRLPPVVIDIALDVAGRGTYETYSRRPGLNLIPRPEGVATDTNVLDPDYGGILRYTYATPEYVIGTSMLENRPQEDWTGISCQNRWHGIIFSIDKDARIFPQCEGLPLDYAKTYNQQWSVQNKSTLIAQKLRTSSHTGDMRVYFSGGSNMIIYEEDGWVFGRLTNAFAAVRPAWGTYSWDDANWIRFSDPYAPAIIEVAPSSDFSNVFSLFKAEVKSHVPVVSNDVLTYEGLGGSGTFTFYTNSTQLPEINGQTIDLQPEFTFSSPFIAEEFDSGLVTIKKGSREAVFNFDLAATGFCGEWGYFGFDINKDCVVDLLDYSLLATQWAQCSHPAWAGCVNPEN